MKVIPFAILLLATATAFAPHSLSQKKNVNIDPSQSFHNKPSSPARITHRNKDTSLNLLLDLPDYFFTFTFPMLGIILQVSKSFGRLRMEERAWELRVEEARQKRLDEDPTLSEIELRRKEAAMEWSAYGKPRMEEERIEKEQQERYETRRRNRVQVMDREDEDEEEDDVEHRQNRMSDKEIGLFEMEYGVDYDPYYDDPYTEDELPEDIKFNVDRKYGDRIYDNGEIFYKDKESGLFYRQGAKPRMLSFWQ
ncbi:MAG: hypothetical protein SGBAC_001424 [Bacillariaceae sp.]